MLSRVADALFWMSRYVERAENVARFIDVNFHMILDGSTGQAEDWNPLVYTTGDHEEFEKRYKSPTREEVVHFLTFDMENANSILACICSARENARTIRDVITSDMWESMNSFYLMLRDPNAVHRVAESPYDFFSQVKQASQSFVGITDLTISHGEAWNFCRVGRLLERTDKTTRLLDVKYYLLNTLMKTAEHDPSQDVMQWSAVLKSASALEMYRKKHRKIDSEGVVEFLLTDNEFPRSALYCLNSADEALHAITGTTRGSYKNAAERELGRLCSEIAYTDVNHILKSELHGYLDSVQTKLNHIGEAIHETFFSLKTAKQAQSQSQGGQSQSQTMD